MSEEDKVTVSLHLVSSFQLK